MSERFYAHETVRDARAVLVDHEAHHALHVMRLVVGDETCIFDGSGREFRARISRVTRNRVELEVLEGKEIDRELPCHLTVGVALPKGDRQRWLIEKLVELGVSRFVPLRTARSVAQPSGKARERLLRTVIESSKQCGRNRLMEIADPTDLASYLEEPGPCQRILCSPHGDSWKPTGSEPPAIRVAVGPEGGWTEQETRAASDAKWQIVGLGTRVLRVETAAIQAASCLSQQFFRRETPRGG